MADKRRGGKDEPEEEYVESLERKVGKQRDKIGSLEAKLKKAGQLLDLATERLTKLKSVQDENEELKRRLAGRKVKAGHEDIRQSLWRLRIDVEDQSRSGIDDLAEQAVDAAIVFYREYPIEQVEHKLVEMAKHFDSRRARGVLVSVVWVLSKEDLFGPCFRRSVVKRMIEYVYARNHLEVAGVLTLLLKRENREVVIRTLHETLILDPRDTKACEWLTNPIVLQAISETWKWPDLTERFPMLSNILLFLCLQDANAVLLESYSEHFHSVLCDRDSVKCLDPCALAADILDQIGNNTTDTSIDVVVLFEQFEAMYSILVLARRMGWTWAHDVLIREILWDRICTTNHMLAYCVFRLIGRLYSTLGRQSTKHIRSMANRFANLLKQSKAKSVTWSTQVACAQSLLDMCDALDPRDSSALISALETWKTNALLALPEDIGTRLEEEKQRLGTRHLKPVPMKRRRHKY